MVHVTTNWAAAGYAKYTGTRCQHCARNRVEVDGVCDKCESIQTCEIGQDCTNAATCFGAYEADEDFYSCDECCDHSCVRGFCNPLLTREERHAPK